MNVNWIRGRNDDDDDVLGGGEVGGGEEIFPLSNDNVVFPHFFLHVPFSPFLCRCCHCQWQNVKLEKKSH